MAKVCAECTYLDLETGEDGEFYCEEKYERHLATDPECNSFCEAYSRRQSSIDNAISYSKSHSESSSPCYLTTMLCNVLKLNDHNYFLDTMRGFRDNVLQKNEIHKPLLAEYDIIGPQIASALDNDPFKYQISDGYFCKYIKPIVGLIKGEKFEDAVALYIEMVNSLKSFYGLDNLSISESVITDIDMTNAGHGVYTKKAFS